MEKNYFTISDYIKLTSKTLYAKIKQEKVS